MKNLKRDLQLLSKQLEALGKKTERIMKAVDRLEKAEAAGKRRARAGAASTRRTVAKKQAADRKTIGLSATDQVVNIVKRAKKGIDVSALIRETGFEDQKIRNILARVSKQGRIRRAGRGVYLAPKERRKHSRIKSLNLLSYVCIDEENDIVGEGMGRTLNVTEGGILLETHVPIKPQHVVSLSIGVKDDLIDVKGEVIHCTAVKDGRFRSGIRFIETDPRTIRILRKFIMAFRGHQDRHRGIS